MASELQRIESLVRELIERQQRVENRVNDAMDELTEIRDVLATVLTVQADILQTQRAILGDLEAPAEFPAPTGVTVTVG